MTDVNLLAVRAAVIQAKAIASIFHTSSVKFYDPTSTTPNVPVLITECRVKKPRPSSFDASNKVEWSKLRKLLIKLPMTFPAPYAGVVVIQKGWVAQIANVDGDPTISSVSFTVQTALTSQFAAEREVSLETELDVTPRIV